MYGRRKILSALLLALAFGAIAGTQALSDKSQVGHNGMVDRLAFPAPVVRAVNLGLNSATASLMWLATIQNLGTYGVSSVGLGETIQTINALDPKFSYPYAFGVLILPGEKGGMDQAIVIGKNGIAQNLQDWRIPYYLAAGYHLVLKDTKDAAFYFNLAAETPGVPDGIRVTAHNYGLRTDLRAQTREIWVSIYETSKDEVVRQQAKDNIDHIDIFALLQDALQAYKRMRGVYPRQLQDLVVTGVLPEIPTDPLGIEYGVSPDGKLTYASKK